MKYLILVSLILYSECTFLPKIKKDTSPYDFYFSATDYECTGRDSTKLCVVDGNHRMFIYTWVWPKGINPIYRKVQKDEIYLGSGYIKKSLPDSLISNITLLKFQDIISK